MWLNLHNLLRNKSRFIITSFDVQCDLFREVSLFCSVLIRSLPQNTINHTLKFSRRPYSGGRKVNFFWGGGGGGGKWLYGPDKSSNHHYKVTLSIGIFPWGREGVPLSDSNW